MRGYEADKLKKSTKWKKKKKDAHAPLKLIQVERAGAEGRGQRAEGRGAKAERDRV